ncbi:MAG: nucleotidyltransferase domain-containing protein [Trichlorobacter sp.]|uniref:nucleotidyltransferase domain-containing protein n=1 Tax=Trichlorobacter sp. TaxID=2911007 RepID=UPI002569F85B|nr:nucleotidyltransferase domain-containing protein [Trichlorobacter sp.]MDK9718127.1 nucleotidyltransferase domain-containing protein [Trichlorobacter sp.]
MGYLEPEIGKTMIDQVVAQLTRSYTPEKIILFGSLAAGTASQGSDIDLLIIKKTDQNPWQRMREVSRMVDHSVAIDLLVYTPEELQARIAMHDFFILDILEHGKVVYERGV